MRAAGLVDPDVSGEGNVVLELGEGPLVGEGAVQSDCQGV